MGLGDDDPRLRRDPDRRLPPDERDGRRPVHEFKERRTYTEVKLAAHRAFPVTLLLGLAGMGLVYVGSRLRASGRNPAPPS